MERCRWLDVSQDGPRELGRTGEFLNAVQKNKAAGPLGDDSVILDKQK